MITLVLLINQAYGIIWYQCYGFSQKAEKAMEKDTKSSKFFSNIDLQIYDSAQKGT